MTAPAAGAAPPAPVNYDSSDSRAYLQRHKLWLFGDHVVHSIMNEKPEGPLAVFKTAHVTLRTASVPLSALDMPAADLVAQCQDYLAASRVAFIIEDWYRGMMETKPEEPLAFSLDFFKKLYLGEGGTEEELAKDPEPKPSSDADEGDADAVEPTGSDKSVDADE